MDAAKRIHSYESLRLVELPDRAKETLRSVRLDKYLNTYAKHSGPNCFATASAAAGANPALADQWLHWPPLKSFLKDQGYKTVKTASPKAGDILAFVKNKTAIHAAFYLGDDLYFEKPGQDFYEPFRVEYFKRWKAEWPETQLLIFRDSSLKPLLTDCNLSMNAQASYQAKKKSRLKYLLRPPFPKSPSAP